MKKILLTTLAALALFAGPAAATDFGLFGSYWDTKDAQQGYGAGVKLDFARYIELRATYFQDVTADTGTARRHDFKLHATPLDAGLVFKFAPHEQFTPYIGGGASYIFLDTNRGDIDDETGWYAVLGADIKTASGLGFMVEGTYRGVSATVRGDDPTDITGKTKIDLGGAGINAGLVWSF